MVPLVAKVPFMQAEPEHSHIEDVYIAATVAAVVVAAVAAATFVAAVPLAVP